MGWSASTVISADRAGLHRTWRTSPRG